jgi:hypothetical protein
MMGAALVFWRQRDAGGATISTACVREDQRASSRRVDRPEQRDAGRELPIFQAPLRVTDLIAATSREDVLTFWPRAKM